MPAPTNGRRDARRAAARIATPQGALQGASLLVVVGVAVSGLATLSTRSNDAALPLMNLFLVAAPLVAAFYCLRVVRTLRPSAAGPWVMFGIAALLAALDQTLAFGVAATSLSASLPFLGFHAFFAAGLAWLIHTRDRGRAVEIGLDALLFVVAASVAVQRWAPGPNALASDPGNVPMDAFVLHATPVFALSALVFALVFLGGREALQRMPIAVLAAAALLLALTALQPAFSGTRCCGAPFSAVAFVAGWGLLAYSARGRRSASAVASGDLPQGLRLRQVMAPAVAAVMGAAVIDTAVGAPLRQTTAISLGLLGILLALRLAYLLRWTRELSADRQRLEDTRALVELSQALASTTELDETLSLVTRWTCRLVDAHAAGIELLVEGGDALEFRAAHGLPPSIVGMRSLVNSSFSGEVVRTGRPRATDDPATDPTIRPESLAFLGNSTLAGAPLRYRNRMLGVLSCVGSQPFRAAELEMLGALADQAAIAIENARLFQQVRTLSLTDPLTGLANRRQLERDLGREFAAARRGRRLVGVMFDLNGFKNFNDQYGHLAGDEALRAFGQALAAETRAMNLAARFGGDEFFVLLADADRYGAEIFVQRVGMRFQRDMEKVGRSGIAAAAGIAAYSSDMRGPEDLLAAADHALYQEKARSRT